MEANNVYKSLMFSSFSHELRTPLNCITCMLETTYEYNLTPQIIKDEFLKPALASSKILLHMIDGILDYSLLLRN